MFQEQQGGQWECSRRDEGKLEDELREMAGAHLRDCHSGGKPLGAIGG